MFIVPYMHACVCVYSILCILSTCDVCARAFACKCVHFVHVWRFPRLDIGRVSAGVGENFALIEVLPFSNPSCNRIFLDFLIYISFTLSLSCVSEIP